MQLTSFQNPQIRDANDNIIQGGTYGKHSPFCNIQNTGILDYINNNLVILNTQVNLLLQASGEYSDISNIGDLINQFQNTATVAINTMNSTTNDDIDAITRSDEVIV